MSKRVVLIGLLAALALVLLSPLASSYPDGLERVAENLGFIDRAQDPLYETLPDYSVPGVEGSISTILAGAIGVVVVFGLSWGVGALLKRQGASTGVGTGSH